MFFNRKNIFDSQITMLTGFKNAPRTSRPSDTIKLQKCTYYYYSIESHKLKNGSLFIG